MKTAFLILTLLALPVSSLAQQAPASPVRVNTVQETLFAPTIEIVGAIHSRHNVRLTAGVAGRLDFVAEPGTLVEQGQEVARIDPLPLTLQQAEQQALIKREQINQKYLQRELTRLRDLQKTNSASAFQVDQMQSQFELAQADLEIAQLKLQQIEDQLSRTIIRAPFSGVVSERYREAGGEINRSEVLLSLLDTYNLEGRLQVPVKYLAVVRQVNSVQVKLGDQLLDAPIKAIIPNADSLSQSFELRVTLPASDQYLWASGQLLSARLPVKAPQMALTVHRDALILRREGTYVVVIDEQNVAHREKVLVGEGLADRVSVQSSGLRHGDKVVTRGAERLQDGQTVVVDQTSA